MVVTLMTVSSEEIDAALTTWYRAESVSLPCAFSDCDFHCAPVLVAGVLSSSCIWATPSSIFRSMKRLPSS